MFPDHKEYINDLNEGHAYITRQLQHPLFKLDQKVVEQLEKLLRAYLDEHVALIKQRIDSGYIVEGHGDLRPEHICIKPPQIIDCIEFQRPFLVLDVVDELAFLYLECDRLSGPEVGERFIQQYIKQSRDQISPPVFDFYKAHNAYIRAYLAIRHLLEEDYKDMKWKNLADYYLSYAISALEKS